jgi:hypothetical protein
VRRLRVVTLVTLAVNLVLLGVNGVTLERSREMLSRLHAVSVAQREWVAMLPPHRCGSVILPGERCRMEMKIIGPTF